MATARTPNFLRICIGRHDGPLFTQACGLEPASLLDVGEAIADPGSNPAAVEACIRQTIDRILHLTPQLARRLVSDGLQEVPS